MVFFIQYALKCRSLVALVYYIHYMDIGQDVLCMPLQESAAVEKYKNGFFSSFLHADTMYYSFQDTKGVILRLCTKNVCFQ